MDHKKSDWGEGQIPPPSLSPPPKKKFRKVKKKHSCRAVSYNKTNKQTKAFPAQEMDRKKKLCKLSMPPPPYGPSLTFQNS